jgi:C-terminal processing protease CtpA/Prc
LRLKFRTPQGEVIEKVIETKPLGVHFKRTAPIVVAKLLSGLPGEKVGVLPGWTLIMIGDTDVQGMEYDPAQKLLKSEAAKLPELAPMGLKLKFLTPQSEVIEKVIETRPLGFHFKHTSPVVMAKIAPGLSGEKAGVLPGWTLIKIGDTDVQGMEYDPVSQLLKSEAAKLPEFQ